MLNYVTDEALMRSREVILKTIKLAPPERLETQRVLLKQVEDELILRRVKF